MSDATYDSDDHGNVTSMPHLSTITYDYKDQMQSADKGGGGIVYFVHGSDGQRARKVWEHSGLRDERIYLGGWEIYRRTTVATSTVEVERETLHVMDGVKRVAMVETKTVDTSVMGGFTITPRFRYQLTNHLDSALVELDETGAVFSYEEFHPYGTTAYRSGQNGLDVSDKRYRYCGAERDEETGFYCMGMRYMCPWLGRWTTADPLGLQAGINLYLYCRAGPITFIDPNGTDVAPSGGVSVYEKHEPEPVSVLGVASGIGRYLWITTPGTQKLEHLGKNLEGLVRGGVKAVQMLGDGTTLGPPKGPNLIDAVLDRGAGAYHDATASGTTPSNVARGVRDAVNTINPLVQGVKSVEAARAAERAGDPVGAGEHLFGLFAAAAPFAGIELPTTGGTSSGALALAGGGEIAAGTTSAAVTGGPGGGLAGLGVGIALSKGSSGGRKGAKSTAEKLPRELRSKFNRILNEKAAGGNRGITGAVTEAQARQLGERFVGPGARETSVGLLSADELRQFRLPASKRGTNPVTGEAWSKTGRQVNFESRSDPGGTWTSNVHLDVRR